MSFELTVLGCSGSHPGAGRACSGYLVTAGDTRILLDCGNGSTANLLRSVNFGDLDAVVVTHRHADHCVDLAGMFYALRYHADGPRTLDLYAADEVVEAVTGLLSGDASPAFGEVFTTRAVRGGDTLDIGPMRLVFADSIHPVPTVSVRVEVDGRALTYSSDSAGGDALVELAAGSDLFLCEATWQGELGDRPAGLHLTARQAGEVATRAGVDRLVLTHILGSLDPEVSRTEARETFDGPLELASDLRTWVLA